MASAVTSTFTPLEHGVRGTERTEPWLSLEIDDEKPGDCMRLLVARLAYEIYDSTTVGSPAPVVRARRERMKNVQPGDLVVETTAMHRAALRQPLTDIDLEYIFQGTGYLIKKTSEPCYPEGEWDEEYEGRPIPHEDIYYVQYGPDPASVCRWHNCEFLAIDIGRRDIGGLVFR